MIEVFKYSPESEDMESIEEMTESIGDYSNYEEDEFKELPKVPEDIAKVLEAIKIDAPLVVYTCETIDDIQKMQMPVSNFWGGEFSVFTDKYYVALTEYGASAIVVPIEYREELVRHLNSLEDYDTEDLGTDGARKVNVASKDKRRYEDLELSSKKMFNNLYMGR